MILIFVYLTWYHDICSNMEMTDWSQCFVLIRNQKREEETKIEKWEKNTVSSTMATVKYRENVTEAMKLICLQMNIKLMMRFDHLNCCFYYFFVNQTYFCIVCTQKKAMFCIHQFSCQCNNNIFCNPIKRMQ